MDLSMLPDFIVEALEHLEDMENSLLQLEQDQGNEDILNEIFRSIHSIKGAAQYIGLERVSELSHKLESLLDLIRQGEKQLNQNTLDLFIAAKDRINLLVDELDRSQIEETEIDDLLHRIKETLDEPRQDLKLSEAQGNNEVGGHAPAGEPARLENETLDEEYDEELLDIFMQQLQENIGFLQTQIAELDSSFDKPAVLNRCRDTIKSLHSSANYMGYDMLCDHYTAWQTEIDTAELGVSSGEETELDFMQMHLDDIIRVYPQAAADTEQKQDETPVFEQKDDFVADTDLDNLDQAIDTLFGDSFEESTVAREQDDIISTDEEPEEASDGLVAALSDAFDTITDTAAPAGELTRLENETLDEEYDEELLDIFMQQLQENIGFLQTQIAELDSSFDKPAVLNRCRDTIKSLYSSANYMGYDMLCDHYTAWQAEIDTAELGVSSGEETGLDFMQMYLDEVIRVYPRTTADMGQQQAEPPVLEQNDDFVTGSDLDDLDQTIDALFNDSLEESPAPEQENDVILAGEEPEEAAEGLVAALSDAFDATTDTATPAGEPARLENETLDEEYDEELLDIFMQQLKENIGFLQTQIAELDSSFDKQAVLNRCSDTIKSLFSSANYMGYNMLCDHYTAWQAEVDTAEQGLSSGAETGLDFMQMHLNEIIRVYPKAAADMGQQQAEPPVQDPKDDFVADPDQDNLDQTLDSLFGDTSSTNEGGIGLKEKEKQAWDESETVAPLADTVQGDYELFGKLKDALEISLDEKENVPVKQMQDVIEKMVSMSSKEEVSEQGTAEKEMPEKVAPSMTSEGRTEPNVPALDDGESETVRQQQDRRKTERRLTPRRKKDAADARKVKHSMRVDTDKIDHLMNQVGELVVSRAYFSQLFNEIKTLQQGLLEKTGLTKNELKPLNEFSFRLGEAGIALGRVSNELQETVMKVRMLPISQLFKRYPRLVRDLVHKSDKEVNLEVRGEETELDKMVIEEMSDPLIHIIRNAVDHGIETVSERKHLGKPETGTLTLEAYHESNHIVIEVTDDGRGIDLERIKVKALEKGLYSEEELERMTPLELTRIIMLPGFSTAEKATETSGRGVGMDVVRKNIEKLNGTIDIESTVGQQTRMRIKIPLTLAIIQALMVRVGIETFAIPLTTVDETLRIFQHEISEIEGVEVIHLRDTTMPIFRLSKVFNMRKESAKVEEDKFFVVVVGTGMQEVGLVVDELLGQEEVVIKPLADYLRVESGFSGATIIGDGAISLILDVPELIEMTTEQQVSKQKDLAFKRRTAGAGMTGQQEQTVH